MEYSLAISILNLNHLKKLEVCQNACIRRIFGGSSKSSVKVIPHLVQQRSMTDRVAILQTKHLMRSLTLPEDTLVSTLLPYLETSVSHSHWYNLTKGFLWQRCAPSLDELGRRKFKEICNQFLLDYHACLCDGSSSKLLSACRPTLTQDSIFWLPSGKPKPCTHHPGSNFSPSHATECLRKHRRLQLPFSIKDLLSFILNQLPLKKSRDPQNAAA